MSTYLAFPIQTIQPNESFILVIGFWIFFSSFACFFVQKSRPTICRHFGSLLHPHCVSTQLSYLVERKSSTTTTRKHATNLNNNEKASSILSPGSRKREARRRSSLSFHYIPTMAPKEEYQLLSSSEFVVTAETPAQLSKLDEQEQNDGSHVKGVKVAVNAPSALARYSCVGFLLSVMAVWWKFSFVTESEAPAIGSPMHSYKIPLTLTLLYVVSLPLLRIFAQRFLSEQNGVDVKALLKETMIVYNASQVLLNGWMVYRFLHAILVDGQPFIGDHTALTSTFAVWIHYTDKYLEFFDTFFMVLRGRMDQVSFLHVYHHTSIAWAWWIALNNYPEGDVYFGALCNSFIHIMMYSYYTLSLLKVSCPWKRYLTQAQLVQFLTVNVYTVGVTYYLYKSDSLTLARGLGIGVQIFEMTSMLVLFMNFYSGAYKKKKGSTSSSSNGATATDTTTKKDSIQQDELVLRKATTKETDSSDAPSSQSSLSSDSEEDANTKKEL